MVVDSIAKSIEYLFMIRRVEMLVKFSFLEIFNFTETAYEIAKTTRLLKWCLVSFGLLEICLTLLNSDLKCCLQDSSAFYLNEIIVIILIKDKSSVLDYIENSTTLVQ